MKIHLKDTARVPEDYMQSPHVRMALETGAMAACHVGFCDGKYITDNPDEVTCGACRRILDDRAFALLRDAVGKALAELSAVSDNDCLGEAGGNCTDCPCDVCAVRRAEESLLRGIRRVAPQYAGTD